MCQYSVPSVIAPIRNKKNLRVAVFLDFCFVLALASGLTLTAVFAFKPSEVQDVYTLNFNQPLVLRLGNVYTGTFTRHRDMGTIRSFYQK